MENKEQELMLKLSMFEQQIQQLQQQSQAVEQAIIDLEGLDIGLEELIGKKDNEILAPVGRGLFVKAKLLSEELTVDIGGGNLVKKSIPETKKILKEQIKKLNEIKEELISEIEKINSELTKVFMENQKK